MIVFNIKYLKLTKPRALNMTSLGYRPALDLYSAGKSIFFKSITLKRVALIVHNLAHNKCRCDQHLLLHYGRYRLSETRVFPLETG